MPRRGENIFKRQDGRWEARYIHHYENGKAKYRYLYANSYAEVKLKRMLEMPAEREQKTPVQKRLSTLEELANAWLADTKIAVKESSYTRYHRTVCKYILPELGHSQLARIDSHAVNGLAERLLAEGGLRRKPLSATTVTDILGVLKAIFRFGKANGYPCPSLDAVRCPPKTGKHIKILSTDSRIALEKLLFDSEETTSLGIIFALFTGVRIGELCGLRWGDIDLANSTVRIARTIERIADLDPQTPSKTKVIVSEPKTGRSIRTIPLPRFLREHLETRRQPDEIYLLTGSTHFIEPHCFYLRYKKYLRRHQLEDNTFHALRHTFATRCVESGFDSKSLAEILGHASVTTTMMFYVHPSLEQKRSQMELLTPAHLYAESSDC